MDVAEVARRARTENFPIASLLFPRPLRPHLRAIYGFCRLVDILGDEAEGDRLALLDECERQLDAPEWPVMVALAPTRREFSLPREPALGRVYLPQESLRRFAVDRLDEPGPELRACLEFEGERARRLLESGRLFRERVPGRTGRAVWLFARGGLAALAALERSGWD